jgi:hypothetical protein
MTKKEEYILIVMLNSFQHLVCFFLPFPPWGGTSSACLREAASAKAGRPNFGRTSA